MASTPTIIIRDGRDRAKAARWCMAAPTGCAIRFKESRRTIDQNSLMWAMLTDVAQQVEWHGVKMSAEDWKDVFTAALKRSRVVPGLDGGFVVLGQRTSDMTKAELSDLIELIRAFCAERGVTLGDEAAA